MQWSSPHSTGYFVAIASGLVLLLLLARRLATSATARSPLLLLLRAGALGVLLVILLDPVRVSETRLPPRPPSVAYLIDGSRSMALDRPQRRLDLAKQIIRLAELQLPAEGRPRVETLGFAESLVAQPDVMGLTATGAETRLRGALEELPGRLGDDAPRAVVLFSDGRATDAAGLDEVAQGYKRMDMPIHVVPLGNSDTVGDVAIQDIVVPREARSGTRIPIRVVVRSRGYAAGRAELRIQSLLDPGRANLARLPITLADGESEHELVLDSDKAKGPLVVEVPPLPREATADNNRVPFQIAARTGKIRVIYMEGTPANEYHWIRDALIEDPDIECVALEVDAQYNLRQRLQRVDNRALGYPATREELFTYDVVICSDINRGAFTQAQLDWTVELVGQRGGGFAMVGGQTSFGSGQWDQTVWDGIIPIDMSGARTQGDNALWNVVLKIEVPRDALDHPIWRIVDDPQKNRQVLNRMPVFYGSNLTDRLKPAATVLGSARVALPMRGQRSATLMPVFSCQSYGKGRTFALSSDSTVDWGRDFEKLWGEGDNRYFRKFWRNVVRWLAENSPSANRRLRVETDKVIYHAGDPIQVSATAFDAKLEPTQQYRLVATLQRAAGRISGAGTAPPAASTSMTPSAAKGDYAATLTIPRLDELQPSGAGGVRKVTLRVTASDGDKTVSQANVEIDVMDDSLEYRDPRPDPALLRRLATTSGGRELHNASELASLLTSFQAGRPDTIVSKSPAWDHAGLWALLVGLLTAEWVARRVKGLF
jgi:uncharacterized membrane protein